MKRSPIRRKTRLKAKGKPRFKNGRDAKFLAWVRSQPCAFCALADLPQIYRTEVEHVQSRGAGGGDRNNCVATCLVHREMRHGWGIKTFEWRCVKRFGTTLKALTAMTDAKYDQEIAT